LAAAVIFFFFEKSIELKKAQRGATLGTLEVYKGLGGRGEERKKIRITNHSRGQPPRSPSEKCKEKQMDKFLLLLRLSKVRILPLVAVQTKNTTLGGAFVLEMLFQGNAICPLAERARKKVFTSKPPLREGTHHNLSPPSSLNLQEYKHR
jgi:hypothetical protein